MRVRVKGTNEALIIGDPCDPKEGPGLIIVKITS